MHIAIGADHAGYELKTHLATALRAAGHDIDDRGTHSFDRCDYPPICAEVGRFVVDGHAQFGIVIGGSGQGEQIAANKVHGVRAALCNDLYTARMARELFGTDWVKLEVIANDDTLQPDLFGLVEAAGILVKEGFKVFPYTTEDLGAAERLLAAGCEVLMPWGAPIGTGRGLANPYALRTFRNYFPGVPLVVDAGLGAPSHASQAMEMGFDAVLLNTAVAKAGDPVGMARAFAGAIVAGRQAFEAGLMEQRDMAAPSTPVAGTPFFGLDRKG